MGRGRPGSDAGEANPFAEFEAGRAEPADETESEAEAELADEAPGTESASAPQRPYAPDRVVVGEPRPRPQPVPRRGARNRRPAVGAPVPRPSPPARTRRAPGVEAAPGGRAARGPAERPRPRGRHRLRRLVVYGLLFLFFLPAVPVSLLRFVPPPASAMMAKRWVDARLAGRDFDLQYEWVGRERISRSLRAAVVASEDQRFYAHRGFDWKELRNAVDAWRNGRSLRGASTISQQVAKNLFLWPGRSFVRKLFEAWFTVWIEALWPKSRILEVYLNVAELGDGVFGAEAAARRYFERPAAKLVPHEAALLAAMLPSPLRANPANPSSFLRQRQRAILRQIQR